MSMLSTRKGILVGLILTGILVVGCTALLLILPSVYDTVFRQQLVLVNGTKSFEMWQGIPFPIYQRLYFFNITNAEEFYENGAKLNLTQVGPYTYKSRWMKEIIGWNPNATVSYRERRTFEFVPEESVGSDDDVITTLNGPLISACNVLKDYSLPIRRAASLWLLMQNEEIIIRKSVKELSFEGYNDAITKFGRYVRRDSPFKHGKFAWFYEKNNTDDGVFNVFTGEDDIKKLDIVDKWNGHDHLSWWNGSHCNDINSTSGETGPPLQESQKTYTFFQSMFCRSLTLEQLGEVTHRSLKFRRFQATAKIFGNAEEYPENACFRTKPDFPSGVQDLSACEFGAPVMASFPHFFLGDPSLLDSVNGLQPLYKEHNSYIDIEPTTGLSAVIMIRFQINMRVEKVSGISQLKQISEGIYPIFWSEINATLTDELFSYLKFHLVTGRQILYAVIGTVLILSGIATILAAVWLVKKNSEYKLTIVIEGGEKEPLLDSASNKKYYSEVNEESKTVESASKK